MPAPLDLTATLQCCQRSIEYLVGEAELCSNIFQRAAQFDGAAVGAGIEHEIVSHPFARGADVALLDSSAQAHHLTCEHCGEGLQRSWIALKGGKHFPLRID